jgi:hypothetical protein
MCWNALHALGWAFHYVIGIAYGLLLVATGVQNGCVSRGLPSR